MAYKIKEIIFRDGDFENYQIIPDKQRLSNLSKINVFIGENNSGKSRFLRELFKNKFDFIPYVDDISFLIDLYQKYRDKFEQHTRTIGHHITQFPSITALFDNVDILISRKQYTKLYESIDELANAIQNFNGRLLNGTTIPYQAITPIGVDFLNELLKRYPKQYDFEEIYIPVLRGLRPIGSDDIYKTRTQRDYMKRKTSVDSYTEIALSEKLDIFTGLNLYEDIKKHLLGSKDRRELVKDFENFLGDNFFNGADVELIPRIDSGNDVVHVKIGNEEERAIYNLGDGIQQIIIMTFPMFMNKGKNMLFYIEEPELYLHPGMQRIFLDTITTHEGFENFQYFIATHSNHFLDITLDTNQISVYTFKKTKEVNEKGHPFFSVENVNNDDISTLELIGVRNSSVFLSNCTIWVEGITDRMYLRKYLELYQKTQDKQFKEDLHYSFVEYAGGNITHWSFTDDSSSFEKIKASRINNKIFLIADNDNAAAGTKKADRHIQLKRILKDNFYLLQCREIENLLAPEVLKSMINNPAIAINYDDYKDKKLADFLGGLNGASQYANILHQSKKVEFAKIALENIKNYSDLSEEAKVLTEEIYDFIGSHNNA